MGSLKSVRIHLTYPVISNFVIPEIVNILTCIKSWIQANLWHAIQHHRMDLLSQEWSHLKDIVVLLLEISNFQFPSFWYIKEPQFFIAHPGRIIWSQKMDGLELHSLYLCCFCCWAMGNQGFWEHNWNFEYKLPMKKFSPQPFHHTRLL